MLKACLNGGVTREEHPAVPITAAELAADSVRVRAAGADAVHVHPRDHRGRESLDPAVIGDAVQAIRESCPGLPIGVSTGAWIDHDRVRRIERWTTVPNFASVNVHEDGALDTARALRDRGVQVEAGIWTPDAARRYRDTWSDTPVLRVLVEIMDDGRDVQAILDALPSGNRPAARRWGRGLADSAPGRTKGSPPPNRAGGHQSAAGRRAGARQRHPRFGRRGHQGE